MSWIDCSCFVGGWPFHKVRGGTFADLRAMHGEYGITGGFVSSTDAIFFNDPFEAEQELSKQLKDAPEYRHVMTVNPTLPGTEQSIRRAASELGIAGVRILPGFHNYSLDTPEVDALCNLLRRLRLPLFLTLRMEDERQCYLLYPRVLPVEEIISFLNRQSGIPTLICNVRLWEITELREAMQNRGDVFADCSGFKDKPFLHEYLTEHDLLRFVVYGSLAPVFCMTSTVLLMKDCVARTRADEILSAENFLNSVARQENS